MTEWLVRQGGADPIGPVSTELLIRGIEAGKVALDAEVCKVGSRQWLPLEMVDEFADVAFDQDAATRVTESPWFAEQRSEPRIVAPAGPIVPQRPRQNSSLGLAAPTRSSPRAAPPPPPSRSHAKLPAPPPPQTLPISPRAPAQAAYGVDDNAMTTLAGPKVPDAGGSEYDFDDETMTRVAAPRVPDAPLGAAPAQAGLLKTAPMWVGAPEIEPVRPAAGKPVPAPRPAAGRRPDADAIQVHPDLQVAPPAFPPAPPGFAPAASAPDPAARHSATPHQPQYFGPTLPPGGSAPAPYGSPPAPQYPALPHAPRPSTGDGGVKALIALIIVLFMALMVVLILLVLRR